MVNITSHGGNETVMWHVDITVILNSREGQCTNQQQVVLALFCAKFEKFCKHLCLVMEFNSVKNQHYYYYYHRNKI